MQTLRALCQICVQFGGNGRAELTREESAPLLPRECPACDLRSNTVCDIHRTVRNGIITSITHIRCAGFGDVRELELCRYYVCVCVCGVSAAGEVVSEPAHEGV